MNNLALLSEQDNFFETTSNVGYSIEAIAGRPNSYRLVLKGFLAPGWTGRLTAGLAQHRIGIVSGSAEKVTTAAWSSVFELKSAAFGDDPTGIDYVRLAATEPPATRPSAKISLTSFVMEPCSVHDGSLYLQIRAEDRLGFLGDLLDYFSMRCLFPVRMTIETVGQTAVDRFWLRGVGGSKPSESIAQAIKENLETLVAKS